MATYAIGDLQGCFFALEKLLQEIAFNPNQDNLWFTGDLVNRGPQSLETLRFIKNLGKNQRIVLGNHDLHLLAVAHDAHQGWPDDTLAPILKAKDREELIDWLLHQPLLHHDEALGFTMIHAGLAPTWDLSIAKKLAGEVESILQSDQRKDFLEHLYGNEPRQWHDDLRGWERIRCIVNYLTRARFCHRDGSLELKTKENMRLDQTDLIPWFRVPKRRTQELNIIFGHWAALGGVTQTDHTFALDTGCIWGYSLTAMRLEDEKRFSVSCKK
ncbi:MAG TPA: symmetrical bis(5'-nucleosyl)-tetraphosphatase [Gammaproteobacteria bacterium]|nr:symmetrical bis(5'-nucleosyl)-tetraphosphatase [Gammaproteobacteria bacterium]